MARDWEILRMLVTAVLTQYLLPGPSCRCSALKLNNKRLKHNKLVRAGQVCQHSLFLHIVTDHGHFWPSQGEVPISNVPALERFQYGLAPRAAAVAYMLLKDVCTNCFELCLLLGSAAL